MNYVAEFIVLCQPLSPSSYSIFFLMTNYSHSRLFF